MASWPPGELALDGLVEVGGEWSVLAVVDDPYVQHRRRRDAGRADGESPEGRLETELEAERGEADALVLVPLRQRASRVRAPLARALHLVHRADQLESVRRLRVDDGLRPLRIQDGVRVCRVHEMPQRVRIRYRAGLEAGGDRRGRILVAGGAGPGVGQEFRRG